MRCGGVGWGGGGGDEEAPADSDLKHSKVS